MRHLLISFPGRGRGATALAVGLITLGGASLYATWEPVGAMANLAVPLCAPALAAEAPDFAAEKPFLDENAAAMERMMAGMDVKPTGDIDRDFVAMMRPHHQGAIDMAQAYLRYGTNEQLRRVAQEIVVEQGQEIAAMNLAIGAPLPPSAAAPTGIAAQPAAANAPSSHHHHATSK